MKNKAARATTGRSQVCLLPQVAIFHHRPASLPEWFLCSEFVSHFYRHRHMHCHMQDRSSRHKHVQQMRQVHHAKGAEQFITHSTCTNFPRHRQKIDRSDWLAEADLWASWPSRRTGVAPHFRSYHICCSQNEFETETSDKVLAAGPPVCAPPPLCLRAAFKRDIQGIRPTVCKPLRACVDMHSLN